LTDRLHTKISVNDLAVHKFLPSTRSSEPFAKIYHNHPILGQRVLSGGCVVKVSTAGAADDPLRSGRVTPPRDYRDPRQPSGIAATARLLRSKCLIQSFDGDDDTKRSDTETDFCFFCRAFHPMFHPEKGDLPFSLGSVASMAGTPNVTTVS
jgi:hypothetical protein